MFTTALLKLSVKSVAISKNIANNKCLNQYLSVFSKMDEILEFSKFSDKNISHCSKRA